MAAQCNAPLRSGRHTMMDEVKSIEKSLVLIFYWHTVVGNNIYFKHTKMGGRTSLFLTSQRMPSRYGCVYMLVQLVNSWSQKIFVFCIFGIYFMNTPLTVCCYNNESQRWWYNAYMNIYNCINIIIL